MQVSTTIIQRPMNLQKTLINTLILSAVCLLVIGCSRCFVKCDETTDAQASIKPVYQQSNVSEIQHVLKVIHNAAIYYTQDYGEDPASVEQLEKMDYLLIDEDTKKRWRFSLIGSNPIWQIEAVSTSEMKGGPGHVVLYDVQSGKFTGYGSPIDE